MGLNDDLNEWNSEIEEIRLAKLDSMRRAMRTRGLARRVHLWLAKTYARLEAWGKRLRDEDMRQ